MKTIIKVVWQFSRGLIKGIWRMAVCLINIVDGGKQTQQLPVAFSYSDDDTHDPNNTTVDDKTYEPGQSVNRYDSF